jgi:hypothetical protein
MFSAFARPVNFLLIAWQVYLPSRMLLLVLLLLYIPKVTLTHARMRGGRKSFSSKASKRHEMNFNNGAFVLLDGSC